MRLQNHVVLITGSTTGIGAAMARRFAKEGARVILHGRDKRDVASRPVTGSIVDIEQYPVIGRIPNQERTTP